jgi:hypothetical protein
MKLPLKINDNKANDYALYFKEKKKQEKKEARRRMKDYKNHQGRDEMHSSLPTGYHIQEYKQQMMAEYTRYVDHTYSR